ncbi:hypothetical protein BCR32DRAFT_250204 [Anaeromyces robustus]|uniref:Uncharacterized protein n=1 Tax=Anaeromyces robustus TaxID=1754192 RepID=A0A1Y1W9Z3_9FUNG|nr:hypothetical protein BCR32DRAFT_250204 [Anaeromyces robustus]|eukprot:ORX70370.1 hypothetical protein BCR32DRAFT_250204 [Anaeromyces robustus]
MEDIINNMKERKNEKQNPDINLSLGEKPKREHRRRQLAPENGLGIIDPELNNQNINNNQKELEKNFLQRPQKERKKKTKNEHNKKSENPLNSNPSSEDLQVPKPK